MYDHEPSKSFLIWSKNDYPFNPPTKIFLRIATSSLWAVGIWQHIWFGIIRKIILLSLAISIYTYICRTKSRKTTGKRKGASIILIGPLETKARKEPNMRGAGAVQWYECLFGHGAGYWCQKPSTPKNAAGSDIIRDQPQGGSWNNSLNWRKVFDCLN